MISFISCIVVSNVFTIVISEFSISGDYWRPLLNARKKIFQSNLKLSINSVAASGSNKGTKSDANEEGNNAAPSSRRGDLSGLQKSSSGDVDRGTFQDFFHDYAAPEGRKEGLYQYA